MHRFVEAKKRLSKAKTKFEVIAQQYIQDKSFARQFMTAKQDFSNALESCGATLSDLSRQEFENEEIEARAFAEIASKEYEPFVKEPVQPLQRDSITPVRRLSVADAKCELARKWDEILQKYKPNR